VSDLPLLEKFAFARQARADLLATGGDPTGVEVQRLLSPTEAVINGRKTLLAGTNNYLGLTLDPECIAAGQQALAEQGTGTTGSRMASGTYSAHIALERELADFYGLAHGMVFSTGYAANLGTLAALCGPDDAIMLDADAHASLYDGCRLTGADIFRFRHNDAANLDKRLGRLGDRCGRTLVVVEGLYSMLGDRAPLAEIADVKVRHGAMLMIDEAHSLGVLGEQGRGQVEAEGIMDRADFIVGTFSKSLGATGGFCVSNHQELTLFRYTSRPFIFTAAPCPSVVATTRAALHCLRTRPQLRERLWDNARRLYSAMQTMGYTVGPEVSPVVAIRVAQREQALALWHGAMDQGIYTNLVLPPATPDGGSLLRCSVSAAHSAQQIDRISEVFRGLIGLLQD